AAGLVGLGSETRVRGPAWVPLLRGQTSGGRGWVLSGVGGGGVHVIAGRHKYARSPAGRNEPLSLWSNRWSTMPVHSMPDLRLPLPDERAALARMPGSAVPVLRPPFRARDLLPLWACGAFSGKPLYDLSDDTDEERNRVGSSAERDMVDALRAALESVEAPAEQFERLGLG